MARCMAQFQKVRTEDLIGPLAEHEKKYAPEFLWVSGKQALARAGRRLSIVGARQAPEEALQIARKLARVVTAHGGVVVSGLARGVDHAAHTEAIESGGRTIAVLGTPPERCYPREHRELQEIIAKEHLCITQFAPGSPVTRRNFPMRNRTMALISHATFIAWASDTSGTLSQAWEAVRLGRPLYFWEVLTGEGLDWVKKAITYGGTPVDEDDFEDLVLELPPELPEHLDDELLSSIAREPND